MFTVTFSGAIFNCSATAPCIAKNFDWNGEHFEHQVMGLDKTKPVFVYCLKGGRSASAASRLRDMGFKEVYELEGGTSNWQAAKLPLTKE